MTNLTPPRNITPLAGGKTTNAIGDTVNLGQLRTGATVPQAELTPRQRAKVLAIAEARVFVMNKRRQIAAHIRELQREDLHERRAITALKEEASRFRSIPQAPGAVKDSDELKREIEHREKVRARLAESIKQLEQQSEEMNDAAASLTQLRLALVQHPLIAGNRSFLRELDIAEGAIG